MSDSEAPLENRMETGTDLIRDHSNYETHSQESQEASDTRLASSIEPTPVSSSQVLLSSAQGPSEGFHASVEDRKKNSSPTSAVAVLGESIKAIVILDAITGYVLVERFYDWPESLVTNEVYKLSSLIKSLYQFSRELEDGSLLSVDFEGYPGSPMSPKSKPRRLPKRPAQQHRGLLSPYQTMRMMCKSSEVIVALFVDMNGELTLPPEISKVLGGFVDHLMEAFIVVYGKLFASLREGSTYSGSATVKTSSSYSESLAAMKAQGHFDRFASTLDEIRDPYFVKASTKEYNAIPVRASRKRGDQTTVSGSSTSKVSSSKGSPR